MTLELQTRVLNRLAATGVVDEPWALAIVAALDDREEFDAFLDGTSNRQMPSPSDESGDAARTDCTLRSMTHPQSNPTDRAGAI